jgi:hypothetical protein
LKVLDWRWILTLFFCFLLDQLFGGDDLVGYELTPGNMDLFSDDKKGERVDGFGASRRMNSRFFSDQSNRSELMTYQPSPYNNNLDLNELLNVAETDAVQNGEINR